MSKIALTMIVKGTDGEHLKLERALRSVAQFVDASYITITGGEKNTKETQEVCKRFNCHVSYTDAKIAITQEMVDFLKKNLYPEVHAKVGDQIFAFDQARNFNLQQVPQEYEWCIWMDSDDVLRNGHNLKLLAEEGIKKNIESFYANYLYQVELDDKENIKAILIQHLRERMFRNTGVYKWVAPIHETLIEQRPTAKTDTDGFDIVHLSSIEDRNASLQRNLKNLEYSIWQTHAEDPRPIYYLAKAFFDLNTPDYNEKAMKLINLYLLGKNPSGWEEERAQAWMYLAELYRRKGEHNNAVKSCMNALIESPEDPAIFLNIATSYMIMSKWERALWWVRRATSLEQKKTTLVVNPKDLQAKTLEVIYNCCLNLHKVDEAWASAHKLIELFPEDKNVLNAFMFINSIREERDLSKQIISISNHLLQHGEAPKIKALLSALPSSIQNNPFMVNLYQQHNPPTYRDSKDVVIYCGQGFTNWSPKRLENPGESFVGGSEEAVILMASALQKQGWNVTVYGDPGQDEGTINGVKWLPYYKFNRLDKFNILIAWRDIRFFENEFIAKKKYLWCHDIQNSLEYVENRIKNVDKVFFLSKWHYENDLDLQKKLPKEKVFYTTNGITV